MAKERDPLRKRVTIFDVARMAGVSPSSVSNALNGRSHAMSEETLARVQDAIARLNYRPSSLARSLVTRSTNTIGVVMAEIETPLFLQALHAIEPIARAQHYNLLLSLARDEADERVALGFLLEKQADGIIFVSTSAYRDEDHLRELRSAGVPVVLINRATRHEEYDQVNWDNSAGVAAATEYFLAAGHRRIAHMVGPGNRRSTEERLAGYLRALEQRGLPCDPAYLLPGDFTAPAAEWQKIVYQILALHPRPTAVLAADDALAATCLSVFSREGVRVPQDIAVVGIDDQPYASLLNPALSTVRLPISEAGRWAMELLFARFHGKTGPGEHVVIPCEFVVRESSG